MNNHCTICLKEKTLSDFSEGKTFIDVEDKIYCVKCFDEYMKDRIIFCEECREFEHKNDNFSKNFVELQQDNGNVLYYHIKCLPEYFLCPICNEYLYKEKCVEIFVDYDLQIEHHKKCIEDKYDYDCEICKDCNISFLRKCIGCDNRFKDCYNENCDAYDNENPDEYIEPDNRYSGFCSKKCYNRYGI